MRCCSAIRGGSWNANRGLASASTWSPDFKQVFVLGIADNMVSDPFRQGSDGHVGIDADGGRHDGPIGDIQTVMDHGQAGFGIEESAAPSVVDLAQMIDGSVCRIIRHSAPAAERLNASVPSPAFSIYPTSR